MIPPTHAQAKLMVIESEALRGGETVNKSWIRRSGQTSRIRSVPFLPYFLCEDLRKMLLLAVFLINHLLLMQHVVEGHVVDLIVHHHRHQVARYLTLHVIMATMYERAQIHAD